MTLVPSSCHLNKKITFTPNPTHKPRTPIFLASRCLPARSAIPIHHSLYHRDHHCRHMYVASNLTLDNSMNVAPFFCDGGANVPTHFLCPFTCNNILSAFWISDISRPSLGTWYPTPNHTTSPPHTTLPRHSQMRPYILAPCLERYQCTLCPPLASSVYQCQQTKVLGWWGPSPLNFTGISWTVLLLTFSPFHSTIFQPN